MSRMHLDVVAEREQLSHQRVVELAGEAAGQIVTQQIGTADGADEEGVAGEDARGSPRLGDVDRDVFRCMSRRVDERQRDVPEHQPFAVVRFVVRVAEPRFGTVDDPRAQPAQLACSRDEVGVDVGFDRVDDRQAVTTGRLDVDVDVASGVDDRNFVRAIACDQERRLSEPLVEDALEHKVEFCCVFSPNHSTSRQLTVFVTGLDMITTVTLLIVMGAGAVAGTLGALLGIGGGVFLVPFLNVGLGLPIKEAGAVSLMTVIATSSAVSAGTAGRQLINLRLGMLLEIASAIGGLTLGIAVAWISDAALDRTFAVVTAAIAIMMFTARAAERDPRRVCRSRLLGGRYHEDESGGEVVYRIKRLPVAMLASLAAGGVLRTFRTRSSNPGGCEG